MKKGKTARAAETPAIAMLMAHGVPFATLAYEYEGGARQGAHALQRDPFTVVKTLVMQDENARPLLMLMHGNRRVSTKELARQSGRKSVQACAPEVAQRHSGCLVGGTSPFATRRAMPVYVQRTILELPLICINAGRRGLLLEIDPQALVTLLGAVPVDCALEG